MSDNINPMSLSETSEFNDSMIANVFPDFQDEGVDDWVLQKLKELWCSEIDPTPTDLDNYSGSTESTIGMTKKDATGVEKPVPGALEYSNIAPFHTQSADVVNLTAAVPQIIHFFVPLWVLKEDKLPQILRNPLLLRSSEMGLQLRVNMAVAELRNQPGALQLDRGLDPIEEESSDEDLEPRAESPKRRIPGDDESLNSGDDLERNVIACQYRNVMRRRNGWRFHLTNGVRSINGKDYVFKELRGDTVF